jgi:transposase
VTLGLTPANKSSGGKKESRAYYNPSRDIAAQCPAGQRMGDQYLRLLLVVGMTSFVRQTKSHPERASKWLISLLERKPAGMATVAMAKKTARVVQAVLTRNEPYTSHTA